MNQCLEILAHTKNNRVHGADWNISERTDDPYRNKLHNLLNTAPKKQTH
ncbi:hypothetical protein [Aequorivita marina]|nr:hypothetical protein [Aequorivita sp. S2608]MDS1298885.1 hypothetical protein [Aequorivita sp. S2608]